MATGYQGYGAGYGDPQRAKAERARQMAELLQQNAMNNQPKNLVSGFASLGEAFIARDAMGKAEKAETSYAKNQERLLRHFMDPNTTEDGYAMQPTINVGADPEPQAATPAPASPMPEGDKVKALARALGGVYEGDGKTADIGAKPVAPPPMQPPGQPGVSPQVQTIAAALGATPAPQAGQPAMTPAPQMAAPMAAPPAMGQAPQSFRPPPPAAPNRQAALMTAMKMTGGNLQEAMSLVEAKYGPAPQGMSAYEAEQIRLKELEMNAPAKPIEVDGYLVDPVTYEPVFTPPAKPTNLPEGMWNGQDGKGPPQPIPGYVDMRAQIAAAGRAPSSADGLTPNQLLTAQLKVDDLDRELADIERSRKSSLSTVTSSIALLDDFLSPENEATFNEVYGNWINPTGEGNDMLNPRVTPGSPRANGMAILEQLGGRAFLDSIQAMKGTGALSDREGAKVGAAATRLMQVTQDDAAARKAGLEFKATLESYKTALENDIQANRVAEASRRQQVSAMMGLPVAPQVSAPSVSNAPEDDDDFIDTLFEPAPSAPASSRATPMATVNPGASTGRFHRGNDPRQTQRPTAPQPAAAQPVPDLSRLTPEQLDALERQLSQGGGR